MMRVAHPRKKPVRHTDDRLLCLSAVLEEFVESKVTGGHSGGGDSDTGPTQQLKRGKIIYSRRCGPDPPDHNSIPIGRWSRHAPSFSGRRRSRESLCMRIELPSLTVVCYRAVSDEQRRRLFPPSPSKRARTLFRSAQWSAL